ncbi:hypothetical protein MC7420_6559 [Coleofasciculus chthonoplastes PCC 7420]|uniref:Uncharacterized protein n=1 Tax=Coleofasciculus chthonoplastes PCC 7420 TaxID=118168 RepID=B4W5B0_9CYAN|nr:hypothetical protein MC7420_6559 [Coleofasciculus chthonoplastes PCC 7420]
MCPNRYGGCYKKGEASGCFAFFARGGQRMLRFCCTGEGEPDSLTPLSPEWERG